MSGILFQGPPRGILSEPEPQGLLGALYQNPLMARQFAKQREFMAPPTSVTDPRWAQHSERQKQADHFLMAADLLGAAAPFAKPGLLGAARMLGPATESYMARTGLLQPITAYHGSPHLFDKFDMSKIGTGEGAQAYGHGLYFAENPGVAKSYQNIGQPAYVGPRTVNLANNALSLSGGDKAKAIARLNKQAAELPIGSRQPIYDAINNFDHLTSGKTGSLYKVDLPDEAVGKMLDWDKPLSQQPESVREAVKRMMDFRGVESYVVDGQRVYLGVGEESALRGQDIYRQLGASTPEKASWALKQLGIPGIKYLDGGSRSGGKGTSNFVVFDDQLPKIIGRE